MAKDTLDRLLTTLAVDIHAFAMCEIQTGWRLAFEPMDAVTVHYILKGTGRIRVGAENHADYAPCNVIVVPARLPQSLGEASDIVGQVDAGNHCGMLADGLVKFTAGDGSRNTLVVCATISATYGGSLGLFDHLQDPVVEDLSQNDGLTRTFALMLEEIATPGVGTQALTEALMKLCLIVLLRQHLNRFGNTSPFFKVLEDSRLAKAVAGVLGRPAAPHSVESLATLAGMSRSVFAERFAKIFEQTPMEFVQRARLRLGAQLLKTTALPVKVVAASVGYASRSHFTRAFRDIHGIDPRSFRARIARDKAVADLAGAPSIADRLVSTIETILPDDAE